MFIYARLKIKLFVFVFRKQTTFWHHFGKGTMAVPLTLQHPLEKAHVAASSPAPFTTNIQDCCAFKHKNSQVVS
jgi:hypothetical protein